MPKRVKRKYAYVFFNAGTYYGTEYPSQAHVCKSKHADYVARKLRKLGFNVKVYKPTYGELPKGAVYDAQHGGYVLPAL